MSSYCCWSDEESDATVEIIILKIFGVFLFRAVWKSKGIDPFYNSISKPIKWEWGYVRRKWSISWSQPKLILYVQQSKLNWIFWAPTTKAINVHNTEHCSQIERHKFQVDFTNTYDLSKNQTNAVVLSNYSFFFHFKFDCLKCQKQFHWTNTGNLWAKLWMSWIFQYRTFLIFFRKRIECFM